MPPGTLFVMRLHGPFALETGEGRDLTPPARKAKALLAALATAPDGRRGRKWLQALLWSDRGEAQGAASLRQTLYEIRRALGPHAALLGADAHAVRLDLAAIRLEGPARAGGPPADFLEGLDVRDPAFEDWLRAQRSARAPLPTAPAAPAAPAQDADADPAAAHDWTLSVTVLPLENRTGDPDAGHVGEGLSEDLIDGLQRLRWLPVIARASAFSGEGAERHSGTGLARKVGAEFVVEGAVARRRGRSVARVRLCSARDGEALWSEVYDLADFAEGAGLEDAMTRIVGAIDRTAATAVQRYAMARRPAAPSYMDHVWRGRWHLARLSRQDAEQARAHLEAALRLQPNGAEALIQLGFWNLWRAWVLRRGEAELEQVDRLARRALALDPEDGRPYAQLGVAQSWRRRPEAADLLLRRAIELNPSLAIAHHQYGSNCNLDDRPAEAERGLNAALAYSPRDPLDFTFQLELAVAAARLGRFGDAYDRATRALTQKPNYWYAHLVRIRAAMALDDRAREVAARADLRASGVTITPAHFDWLPFRSRDWPDQLRAAMA